MSMQKGIWIALVLIIGISVLIFSQRSRGESSHYDIPSMHPMTDQQLTDAKVIEIAKQEAAQRGYSLEHSKIQVYHNGTTTSVSFLDKDQPEGMRGSIIGVAGPGLQVDVDTGTLTVITSHFIQ